MPAALKGTMIQCDPSIKALILRIDSETHDIIIEDLDDTHLLIDQNKVSYVKAQLNRLLSENVYNPLEEDQL